MSVQIWHNPRCSKSRTTLALLHDRGITPEIIDYRTAPPSVGTLRDTLAKLNRAPIEIMRSGDTLFKELGLSKTDNGNTLIRAMAENPMLIERPIVFANGKAAIGRPPEAVLDIL